MKNTIVILLIVLAGTAGWWLGRNKPAVGGGRGGATTERKVAFYQSSMHPWIKSDKPGNCTICGMKLTPVYEGEQGFSTDAKTVTLSSNAINVLDVQTELAQVRPLERTLRVAGRIESDETRFRIISAYVDGRIEKLFFNYAGAEVKAGEPLAILYSPVLLTAEREYLTVVSQTNLASSPVLRGQQERLIESAKQRLRRLGLTDEQIASVREGGSTNFTTQVTAPMGGTVVTRAVSEGQYIKEGDKLFEIADLSRMWFRFDVYEQDLASVQIGDVVRVSSPALGAGRLEGRITFIDPNIKPQTRSAQVRVDLQNPEIEQNGKLRRQLFNGLYAEGSISIQSEPVLTVHRSAVLQPGDEPRVYIDQGGGAYEHRTVKVGRLGESFIEILDGLEAGEKVVTSGNLLLDGQAQLNRSIQSPGEGKEQPALVPDRMLHPPEQTKPSQTNLLQHQIVEANQFLAFPSGLNEHLAADNLDRYNELLTHIEEAISPFAAGFGEDSPLKTHVDRIVAESKKLKPAPNLESARAQHNSFSKATFDFFRAAKAIRGEVRGQFYKCPMYPKPGQNAFWVQAQAPLRNPFYGSEMLECGTEVK